MMADEQTSHEIISNARQRLELGEEIEGVLWYLRESGATPMESIKLVREALRISLGQAKDLVHESQAWSDAWDRHNDIHDSASEALESLAPVSERAGKYRTKINFRSDRADGEK